MKIVKYKSSQIPENVYSIVSNLLYDAFEERRLQNINFRCGVFTPVDVKKDLVGENYLLLVYNDDGVPMGTASLKIRQKFFCNYGTFENLGVASSFKRKGVGSILAKERIKIAKELNLDFLTSCTATNAESSVHYHLKMGFVIFGKNYGKGYNSYSFIYPIKKFKLLRIAPFRWMIFTVKTGLGIVKKIVNK